MKNTLILLSTMALLTSCGGSSDEQKKAATEFCDCMEKAQFGDFDIDFYECDLQIKSAYSGDTFSDDGWGDALDETCPDVAGKIEDNE